MVSVPNNEALKKFLLQTAIRKCWNDDPEFNAFENSGGNYDDAYYGGFDDGEARFAQQILQEYYGISPKFVEG
jgi:hypothetical protein